ncbi:MAG TPA: DNA topoisomerase I, partial [Cyanobacteria bacterium UBA11049]|nr:DNA topoisomerase I [Cyanobacteria bacterium UBA11049]
KQYRYHPHWQQVRSQAKFNRMIAFASALPKIRQQTQSDLALRGLPRAKVLATVIRLLELTQIRVGNEEYATTNRSFGLTTMRDRHVDISGSKIAFKFRGKSGVEHDIELSNSTLAKIVKRCQDVPGQELFQYLDEDGQHQPIDSGDVNDYLRSATGLDFTAKDFRTWSGTVLAAIELNELKAFETETQAKKNITQAIKDVAKQLGNRPATCRKYYVHPAILDAYQDGTLCRSMPRSTQQKTATATQELQPEELVVLQLLKQHLVQESHRADKN